MRLSQNTWRLRAASFITQTTTFAEVTTDPDDDPIAALAIEGQSDVLCTWDRRFFAPNVQTHLCQFGIRVLRDTELLAELKALMIDPSAE